ncbi:hypothetical protein GH714_013766 [Hevea brasiliensis]|uniref:DUF4219 domain-containing protein n=1 Tax=Hevea brasiliensis TaxID=3981 RepID=A0A6A6LGB5_HEVBR|nr:hypothetical protein GH714_013766 [Hevea brasiliensis]
MTSEGSFIQPAIPRFDGHYDHWSMLMENFLRSKEFWELVESGYIEPSSASAQTEAQRKKTEEMKLKDLKVKNYLFQAIDRTVLDTILKKDTAKDIWDAMKKKFEGNAKVKRSHLQALRREFETLEMRSSEGVTEYFSRVMTVANKMRLYGEDMQDVKVVEKILRSLTEKFNYVVCSIEESKDIDALTVDELQSSLIVHEQKFQRRNGEEQAAKRALRYLKGTVNYGIHYKKGGDGELLAFTDSDYAGDMEDMKSTSGYVFLMNSSAVSWCSKKQPIVTLSTTEAEFVAAAVCACQGVWIKRILKELGQFDGGVSVSDCVFRLIAKFTGINGSPFSSVVPIGDATEATGLASSPSMADDAKELCLAFVLLPLASNMHDTMILDMFLVY